MPELLSPDDPRAPKYWMNEVGGHLRPAIERYLNGQPEQPDDVHLIRAYLRQWVDAPVWMPGPKLDELRTKVRGIRTRLEVDWWLEAALELMMDPL